MKNNEIKLENHQTAAEENNYLTMEVKIDRQLIKERNNFKFEPILKNATGYDWDYEEGEFYIGNDNKVLKGFLLHNSRQEGMDGNIQREKEIFLTEEGRLLVVTTLIEYVYCHQREQVHCRLHRVKARDQSLNPEEAEAVLSEISFALGEES